MFQPFFMPVDYADVIPMESNDNNGTILGSTVHTYATVTQVDEPAATTAAFIAGELNGNSVAGNVANGGTVVNGNGHLRSNQPSVAIYEQPIFSQSQHESTFIVSHHDNTITRKKGNVKLI